MSSSRPEQLDDLQLRALAGRYVWWQPADETLRNPIALLWSVLKTGTTTTTSRSVTDSASRP